MNRKLREAIDAQRERLVRHAQSLNISFEGKMTVERLLVALASVEAYAATANVRRARKRLKVA